MRIYCIAQGTLLGALGDLNGKKIQNRGHICVPVTDSFCCTIETNSTVRQLYPN